MQSQRLLDWSRALGIQHIDTAGLRLSPLIADYNEVKRESFDLPVHSGSSLDPNKFNPLSKVTTGNPWTAQYENQNRMNEIKLDIDRTFQEMPFFQRSSVQKSLINILFVFGKRLKLQYRQGMNEICAILFHVVSEGLSSAAVDGKSTPQIHPSDEDSMESAEAVTFALFTRLMMKVGIVDFFFTQPVVAVGRATGTGSPILIRSDKIFELLAHKDQRLHKHLLMNDIPPNLYLVRWVRLLFAREFSFTNIVKLWDFFFTHIGPSVVFPCIIDYFAVAMILHIRQSLITSDNSGCFTLLLKYPQVHDIGQLLDLTLQVRDGTVNHALNHAPVLSIAPASIPVPPSRRDRVLSDLSSVIDDLKRSSVAGAVQKEIGKLEDLVNFIRPVR